MGNALKHTVFSLLLVLALPHAVKSQTPYPGCPNISTTPSDPSLKVSQDTVVLKCGQTCVDLKASVLQTGSTSAYKVSSIPFAPPFAFTAGNSILVNRDDYWSDVINLPFNFCFFGVSYNKIVVGANGQVTFNTALAGTFCCYQSGNPIPNAAEASCPTLGANENMFHNSIYGAFHDLDLSISGGITCGVLGTAPCRTFVVNYNNMAHYDCSNLKTTQQIVIYETTNVIEVYIKNKPICASWFDGNAVIGIQNAAGSLAYAPPGRNVGPWSATNEAWRFTPDGPPNYTLTWTDLAGNVKGTGATVNICPPSFPMKYIAKISYTNCDNAVISDRDTIVLVNESITGFTSPDTVICEGDSATLNFTNTSPPGTYSFSWSGPNLAASNVQNTKAKPTDSSLYVMTVTSGGGSGCVYKDSTFVRVTKTDPGTDGTVVLCNTSSPVDLFTKLGGTPESGGSWTDPSGNPFTNPLDPSTAVAGDYTYSLKKGVCPAETAKVKVTINKLPNAGVDGQDTLCNSVNNGNLFNFITNEPTGGTWVGQGVAPSSVNPTTGVINVTNLTPGSYKYLYVVKSGAPCPNDTAVATVHVKALPTATFPPIAPFCKGTTAYLKPVFTGVAPFTLTFIDCAGNTTTLTNMNNGDSIAISPTTSPCVYTITSVSDGGAYSCTNNTQSTRSVSLLTPPIIQLDSLVCNITNTGYNAYCTLSGGDSPTYKVNNATTGITGSKFKSALLPGGSTYNFTVTDKNGCTPVSNITGFKNCDCTTDAGSMKNTQIDVCGTTPAVGTHNNDHAFDGNDTKNFVLHDNAGVSLGKVYAVNPTSPTFTYDSTWGINYNQTYYISAIVGDKQTGNATLVDTTNSNGCLSVAAGQPVQFHQIPAGNPNAAVTQVCLGDSILIDVTFTAGKELYSFDYSVNGTPGSVISGLSPLNNTFYVTPPLLGSNQFTFTSIKDTYGCTASMSVMIDVVTTDAPVAGPETKTCNNINTEYTVSFTITKGDQPTYEVDGTSLGGSSTFTSAPVTSGNGYTYTLNDKNNCNPTIISGTNTCPCVSKAGTMTQSGGTPQEFCINAVATVGHNGDQVFDGNDVLSFILCSNPANPTGAGSFLQHKSTLSFSFAAPMTAGTTYYIVPVAGDDNGSGIVNTNSACINYGSPTPVKFIALPTVSMTGSKEICYGDSATVTFTITGNGNVKFTLVGDDGSSQNLSFPAGTATIKVSPPASMAKGIVTYTIDPNSVYDSTQPSTCKGTAGATPVVIEVHPIPTATISGKFIICQGEAIKVPIVTTGDGALTTVWSKTTGQPTDSSFTDIQGNYNKLITNTLAPGTHYFAVKSIKDNTAAACQGTVSGMDTVIVQPIPTATLTLADDTICRNDSTQITFVTTGNPNFNIYYHDTQGPKYSHLNQPLGSVTFTLKPASGRTYILDSITDGTLSAASNRSCFKVYNTPGTPVMTDAIVVVPLPTGKLSGDTGICFGESTWIRFEMKSQPYNFARTATYEVRNKVTGSVGTAIFTTNNNLDSVKVTPPDTTTYRLTKIQDAFGCVATNFSGSATVDVNPIPVPIIAATDTASCPPLVTRLINLTDSRYLGDYTWHYGNGSTSAGNGSDPGMQKTYDEAGSYDIRLEVTSPQGCYKDTVVEDFLTVHPFPRASFSWMPNPTDLTNTYIHFDNHSEGQEFNSWKYFTSSGALLDTSDRREPAYTFPDQDTGSYPVKLLVTTEFGCQDSLTQTIVIGGIFEAYIPNSFSPNADGINDYFLPILIGEAPQSYELSVFNRWGEMIFHSTNYKQGWDGTYQGEPVKEDVYIFHLKVRSKYNAEKKDVVDKVSILR